MGLYHMKSKIDHFWFGDGIVSIHFWFSDGIVSTFNFELRLTNSIQICISLI